jgi:hypothetical protein
MATIVPCLNVSGNENNNEIKAKVKYRVEGKPPPGDTGNKLTSNFFINELNEWNEG